MSSIVGPLNFVVPSGEKCSVYGNRTLVKCLFCPDSYQLPESQDALLAHLFLIHKFVISDVAQVAMLDEYLQFWLEKFSDNINPKEFCSVMLLNQLPDGTNAQNTEYLLLSDDLPMDFELRTRLHRKRLEAVLDQHQFERTDQNYSRGCLYCRDELQTTNRSGFLEHLFNKHFLNLGRPANLVFIDELIDDVQDKLDRLICLFCSRVFPDRPTLKEHMRKKGHKRINPTNKAYDKFYLINYKKELKPINPINASTDHYPSNNARHNDTIQAMVDEHSRVFQTPDGSDSDWSDWEEASEPITCLFCDHKEPKFSNLKVHIQRQHLFDLDAALNVLTFYQKVKVINYIRRQMHIKQCVMCAESFDTKADLEMHLTRAKHHGIGSKSQWDQPEFYFPTYEDDPILCNLDDTASPSRVSNRSGTPEISEPEDTNVVIIAEEFQSSVNPDAEALSQEFMIKL